MNTLQQTESLWASILQANRSLVKTAVPPQVHEIWRSLTITF